MKSKNIHFRVDTMKLLHEIFDNAMPQSMGIIKTPINIFKNLLGEAAERAIELNDPILNRIMFDLTLYELPEPTSKEYRKMFKEVYDQEKKYRLTKTNPPCKQ